MITGSPGKSRFCVYNTKPVFLFIAGNEEKREDIVYNKFIKRSIKGMQDEDSDSAGFL